MFHLANILDCSAREYADKTAIVFGDKRITYAQLNAAANQVAGGLTAAGIGKGDKVALSCPNLPYFPMLYFGILKTGAV
jgi:long-chain acyl-CoA synthetase